MAIVKMSQFELLAFDVQRDELLKHLQTFDDVHFVDLREEDGAETLQTVEDEHEVNQIEDDLNHLEWMFKLLKSHDTRPSGLKGMKIGQKSYTLQELEQMAAASDFKKDYYELKDIQEHVDSLNAKMHENRANVQAMKPWNTLQYAKPELESLTKTAVILGSSQRKYVDKLKETLSENTLAQVQTISEDSQNMYLMIVVHKEVLSAVQDVLRKNGFVYFHNTFQNMPSEEIRLFDEQYKELEIEKDAWLARIPPYAVKLDEYEAVYESKTNELIKFKAARNFLKTSKVNLIKGFVPTDKKDSFVKVLEGLLGDEFHLTLKDAQKDDLGVPVKLKNNTFTEAFSSITGMYALPKYNEVDPTPFFAPFYWMFFGMMGADVGYGLIMMLLTGVALKFFNLKESMRKFVRFFFFLSFAMILWGFIYGSFFGNLVPLPYLIDTNKDFMLMLVIAVGMGLIHLFFALGIKAYMLIRDKKPMDAVYDVLSWYLALAGGIMWLVGAIAKLPPGVITASKIAMIIGMVMIVLFAGRDSKSLVGRLIGGLYSLYGISSYVGDFVSYSRLMALGLSGGFIGVALNMIVQMLFGGGIIGILIGLVVFAGFHAFNIFLSGLGAYVHTSRLTYVEFFGKFYEGGGKAFRRFRATPKYIQIKEK